MTYDYVLIGAGSAGCVLANRLSADPAVSVLLLEAGGPGRHPFVRIPAGYAKLHGSAMDWGYWTEPQPYVLNRRMYQPRGKGLGGSSATNAMAYIRGNRADYDGWAALGNRGWGYDDLLPYFIRAEDNAQYEQLDPHYHGRGGPLHVGHATHRTPLAGAFVEACGQAGIPANPDFNGAEQAGAGLFQFTIRGGQRCSTAAAYLRPAMHRPNLRVITHAPIKQILVEADRATGVEFFTGKTTTQRVAATREVLLCAGAFGSPQLLMLSGIGDEELLKRHGIPVKKHLPGVGRNLQDHVFTGVSSLARGPVGVNHYLRPWDQTRELVRYLATHGGALTMSPLEANAFLKIGDGPAPIDLQLHFAPIHLGETYQGNMYDVATFPRTDGFTILPTVLRPESVGQVTLHSADPRAAPCIDPHYLEAEADRVTLVRGVRKALEVMEAPVFGPFLDRLTLPPDRSSDEALLQHARRMLECVYHPVGTCRMGTDEGAVLTDELKVRGLGNLRVIDASIMPAIISGNTNAAVIAIAEKMAAQLA